MKICFLPQTLICIFFLVGTKMSFAQNSETFFKDIQVLDSATPEWAVMMHGENPNVRAVEKAYEDYYQTYAFEKTIHTQNYKHWIRKVEPLINEEGYILQPSEAEKKRALSHTRNLRSQSPFNKSMTDIWESIGPFNTYNNNGDLNLRPTQAHVNCLAVASSDVNIVYCATAGGGLFKSIDKGLNWFMISKDEVFTSANDIKVHPTNPNIVYVGTGDDIYKTIDGGVSWDFSVDTPGTIEQLYIHELEPTKVFAATSNGLFYTTDAGDNWTNIRSGRHWDIEANPENPNTIYLATKNETSIKAEIFKSTNAGLDWTLKDGAWYVPTDLANASESGCKIGLTPADTNRVYACMLGNSKVGDQNWIGVYYSLNGGDSWIDADGQDGGPYATGSDPTTIWYCNGYSSGYNQGWYNFDLDVSTTNADRIWVGTIWDLESNNRGGNFESVRSTRGLSMHADVQDIEVVGDEIWIASDGGINYSNDELQTTETRNTGISASNFWGFTQGWNEDTWAGGRYHNGDAVYHENFGVGNTMFMGGAEAATGHINQFENRKSYYTDISSKILPDALNESSSSFSKLALYPNSTYSQLRSSEIEHDPRYGDHFYLGKDNIFYKSTDTGVSFTALFNFPIGSDVLEFEIARSNPNLIYCLVRENSVGTIYKSINGGNNFTALTAIPSNNINYLDLSMDQANPDHLWVISRYGSNGNKVYASMDGGVSWVNKTTSTLDGQQFLDVDYQTGSDDIVYLLSFDAVFYYSTAHSDWVVYSEGLPLVLTEAREIELFYRDSKVRLSGGRGIWEAPFAGVSSPVVQPMTKTEKVFCSRDTIQMDCYSFLDHETATWAWSFSPAPAFIDNANVRNPRVVFQQEGSYEVTLTVTNANGTSSKTVPNFITLEDKCSPDPVPGHALQVINSGDFATVESMDITTNEFTISTWVKLSGVQPIYSGIVMNDGTTAGVNFKNNNELGYHWPGGSWSWNSGLVVPEDEWAHVALVVTPNLMTIYLNGVASTHSRTLDPADLGTMKFGSYKGWGSRNMNGEIDEIALWNRSLSQEEIREIRHLTRDSELPISTDLISYYQFNNTESTTILDKIGSKNALLQGNAMKVNSSAPVAGGEVHRLTVDQAGDYVFGTTGVELSFGSSTPNGELVVSRLDVLPNVLPTTTSNVGNYWVVNNYGTESFDELFAMKFTPSNGAYVAANASTPEYAHLYKRTSNDHLDQWVDQCGAISAVNGVISYDNSCSQMSFSQFIIADETCPTLFDLTGVETNSELVHYEAQRIESTQNIKVGSQVEYDAKQNIILKEGFITENGSNFYAYINGCGNLMNARTKDSEEEAILGLPKDLNEKNENRLSVEMPIRNIIFIKGTVGNKRGRMSIYNDQGRLKKDLIISNDNLSFDLSSLTPGNYHYLLKQGRFMKSGDLVVKAIEE